MTGGHKGVRGIGGLAGLLDGRTASRNDIMSQTTSSKMRRLEFKVIMTSNEQKNMEVNRMSIKDESRISTVG